MRLLFILTLLLFVERSHAWKCQGTCRAMDQMAQGMGATCTKSQNCLVLTCLTPSRASQYGVVAEPTFHLYPCTDPVILNLKLEGSIFGQIIHEDRNFTEDDSFPETMTFFGRQYTVYIHITMRHMTGKIRFGMSASFGSKSYTLVPPTDIPIDKSGCPGVKSTTHNPLCSIATPTQLATNATTAPTNSSILPTYTSILPRTETNKDTSTESKSVVTPSTTKPMDTSTQTGTNSVTSSTRIETETNRENSTLIISQQQQQLIIGVISGGVVAVVVILILSIIFTLIIVYFMMQKRRKTLAIFRYSNINESIDEV